MEFLYAALALLAGLAVGYLFAAARAARREAALRDEHHRTLAEHESARAAAVARAEAVEQVRKESEATTQALREEMEKSFGHLAGKALRDQGDEFLKRADLKMQPLEKALHTLGETHQKMEHARSSAYGDLKRYLDELQKATDRYGNLSQTLTSALRGSSQARGRWGEMALRNVAEMAGMTQHCDFSEQEVTGDGSRPDMVVRLPEGGFIPVDAKAPLAAYHDAVEAEDPDLERKLLKQHADDLRHHVRTLARRDYASSLAGRIDFTVLFLPGEHFLSAALQQRSGLHEEAMRERILIATPATLLALLRTVGTYWQQQAVAENAEKIWDAARDFHARVLVFQEHLGKVGKGLEAARKAYNQAVGSYERKLLPAGRRIEELQAGDRSKGVLEPPKQIEDAVRPLAGDTERELEAGS